MTENQKTTKGLIEESRNLRNIKKALEIAKQAPFRGEAEQANWAQDYVEMKDKSFSDYDASCAANVKEALRFKFKVEEALNNSTLQRCISRRKEMFFENEDLAHQRCVRDFGIRARLYGEKAFESETIQKLDSQYSALQREIIKIQWKPMDNKQPQEAEILARRKLRLPEGVSLTKTDEKPKKNQPCPTYMANPRNKS